MATSPKALITGATGFIGSHLAERLIADGWRVRCLVRSSSLTDHLRSIGAELILGDVRDRASLPPAINGCDVVFHVAAHVAEYGRYSDFVDINIGGMRNMIEAVAASNVSRFVDVSSTSVHGFEGFNNSDETEPYRVSGVFYSDTKRVAEQHLWDAHHAGRLRATVIRPCMVWGPRDSNYFAKLIPNLRKGRVVIIGSPDNNAGLVHVRNVVDALVRAAVKDEAIGEAFIVTDDCGTTVRTLLDTLAARVGGKVPGFVLPHAVAKAIGTASEKLFRAVGASRAPFITRMGVGCVGNNFSFNISKIRTRLGYVPLLQFPDGLDEYLAWHRAARGDF